MQESLQLFGFVDHQQQNQMHQPIVSTDRGFG